MAQTPPSPRPERAILPNVLVATPVAYYRPDVAYTESLLKLAQKYILPAWSFLPGDCDVRHARNKIVGAFMRSSFEALIFIDEDIGYEVTDFELLCQSDARATCGIYAKKQSGAEPSLGLGFAKLHRSVFEKITEHPSVQYYTDDDGSDQLDFFGYCLHETRWVSESIGFWKRLENIGITPRFITPPQLSHFGRARYKLQTVSIQS